MAAEIAVMDTRRFAKLVLVDSVGIKPGGPFDRDIKGLALMNPQWVERGRFWTWTVRRVQCIQQEGAAYNALPAIIPSFCSTSLGIAKERRYDPETCIVPMAGRNSLSRW